MQKLMLIVNPNSGKNGLSGKLQDIITMFDEKDWRVTVFPTHKKGDATEYILENYADYDLTVCCGGDGTLNETITGLMRQPLPPKLGYIPVGTANDLAATLHINKNPLKAAEDIIKLCEFNHDIGCFNDKFFSYIAAFGTFSNISYSTPQGMKKTFGKAAYVMEAVRNIKDIKPHHAKLIIDGEVIEGEFVVCAIMNSSSFAGIFKLRPDEVKYDDGIFEVMLIRPPKNPVEVAQMMDQLIHKRYDTNDIMLYHAKDITVITEKDTPWCLDGELGGYYEEIHITASERKMTFIAGHAQGEDRIQ